MPSPFPGMNPYLEQEQHWNDFHQGFIAVLRELLSPQVLPRYFVRLEEHLYIRELPESAPRLLGHADVSLTPTGLPPTTMPSATAVLESPARVAIPEVDIERSSYLEVRERDSQEVVTVVELLSPSNKYAGPDREQYLTKRHALLARRVNLVEIDLLRGGPRLPLDSLPECDYYALVSRPADRPQADLWPIRLRKPLPIIPIPLRSGEADAQLDLQQALHRTYDIAGYEVYIYRGRPQPQLRPEDVAWAQQFLPQPTLGPNLSPHLKQDTDLDALRDRADFKALLQELEAKPPDGSK